ncbi:MAG: GAF domain-containing protein [Bdellovibrionota bacterium]
MGGNAPSKKDFTELLEEGAKVDDIFKDKPVPRGSNPFDLEPQATDAIAPLSVEEVKVDMSQSNTSEEQPGFSLADPQVLSISDNETLFIVNRKFAALEALFKLVPREYYSFGQLVSEILRIAMEQVKSEAGSFLEIDHQNQCMFFRAVTGRSSENLLNFTVPLGQGVVGFVCETQQPMALSSVDDSSVYLRSISDAVGFEAKNLVAYPIIIRGVTFGCIELLNRLGEPQYTDADKEVMHTIAEYAARVIENRLIMAAMSKQVVAAKANKAGENAA